MSLTVQEQVEVVKVELHVDPSPSPLLTLPAEIRNEIFRHVLTESHIHLRYAQRPGLHWAIPRTGYFYHHLLEKDRPPPLATEAGLLAPARSRAGQMTPLWRVCKQLHAETLHVPWCEANVFSFEDRNVLVRFLQNARPEQLEGIKNLWIIDDSQSAMCMEVFAPRLAAAKLGYKLCDMTVFIRSQIRRMKEAADEHAQSSIHMDRMRRMWDLSYELKMVSGLQELWEELVQRVIVREV